MKKLISVLLIMILIFGAVSVSVSAVSQEKITEKLQTKLSALSEGEKIGVTLDVQYTFGGLAARNEALDYADKVTGIDCDNFKSTDELREYYRVYRIKMNEIMRGQVRSVMNKLGLSFDDVSPDQQQWQGQNEYYERQGMLIQYGLPSKYSLTKEKIESLTDFEEVKRIDYFGSFKVDDDLHKKLNSISDEETVTVYIAYDFEARYGMYEGQLKDVKYRQEMLDDIGLTEDAIDKDRYDVHGITYLPIFPNFFNLTEEQIQRAALSQYVEVIKLADPVLPTNPESVTPEEKLSSELSELLPTLSDSDVVNVWLSVRLIFKSRNEFEDEADRICGYSIDRYSTMEEVNQWRSVVSDLQQQDRRDTIAALMDELSLSDKDVTREWSTDYERSDWPSAFTLSKERILDLIHSNKVISVDLYTGQDVYGGTYPEYTEGKISDRLRAKFNVVSFNQKIEVWLSVNIQDNYAAQKPLMDEASEKCGFTRDEAIQSKMIVKILRWYSAYNRLHNAVYHQKALDILTTLGIEDDDILDEWDKDNDKTMMPKRLLLTRSQIESIAEAATEVDEVSYLDLYIGQDAQDIAVPEEPEESLEYSFTGEAFYKGDSDDDFVISVIDATLIQKKLAKITDDPDGVIARNGDVTGDGLDVIDATLIQKKLAGYEIKFDVGAEVIIP